MSIDNVKLKACPKITGLTVTDDEGIKLTWSAVEGAERYGIRKSLKHSGYDDVIKVVKTPEFTDGDVKRDTTYWYRITAMKNLSDGKLSRTISSVAAQVVSDIPAPTQVRAVMNKKGKAEITWKAPQGVTSFIVNKRNEFFNQIIPVATVNGEKFVDSGIASGQMNYYSIQSVIIDADEKKDGNFSEEVSCVFLDKTEIIEAKAGLFRKVSIKARIVAGADGYIIERSRDKENYEEIGRTKKNTDYLFCDKTERRGCYYYRVRAFKKNDGKEIVAEASEAVKVKTK